MQSQQTQQMVSLGQILAEIKKLCEKRRTLIKKYISERSHSKALEYLSEYDRVNSAISELDEMKNMVVKNIRRQLANNIHPDFEDADVDAFYSGTQTPCGFIQGTVLIIRVGKFHVAENEFKRIINALSKVAREQGVDIVLAVDWWENRMPPSPKPVCDYFYYVYHIKR